MLHVPWLLPPFLALSLVSPNLLVAASESTSAYDDVPFVKPHLNLRLTPMSHQIRQAERAEGTE